MTIGNNKRFLQILKKARPVFRQFGVKQAGIFGSYARGEQHRSSDIDILVSFEEPAGLFEFIRFKNELQKKLGKKLDVVTYKSLSPLLKNRILSEEVRLYEKR
ncbi:nucleotidyltransferase family protein [Candidatus Uhrbacteria bacterium]|nr:nucleotidyltransferase family protein [Candidatus Uhrbacteria bacterium]